MILSISNEVNVFLLCILIGLLSGVIYDVFKIIRKSFKHKYFIIQIEDIMYWIIVTFMSFLILLHKNNGDIRMYGIIGWFIGYVINETLISKWTVKTGVKVVNYIIVFIKQFVKITIFPIRVLLKIFNRPLKFVTKKGKNKVYTTKNMLKKNKNKLQFKLRHIKKNIEILKDKK